MKTFESITLNTGATDKKRMNSNPTEVMHAGTGCRYADPETGTAQVMARYIELTAPGQATVTLETEEYYHSANVNRQLAFDNADFLDLIIDNDVIKHVHGKTVFGDGTPTQLDMQEIPPLQDVSGEENDLVLQAPKGTVFIDADGKNDRVLDRTIYPQSTTLKMVIRTVNGKVFHSIGLYPRIMGAAVVGDFFKYSDTQMCLVYEISMKVDDSFPNPVLVEIARP
ncbi:hypothetical protein ACNFG0_03740 [Pseudomonas sp. NY15372]|uniref:hypothetical protein n=1 Tax=Pseudomonas sp. NY15372 TaxID=3400356 RepID=UPI003A86618D